MMDYPQAFLHKSRRQRHNANSSRPGLRIEHGGSEQHESIRGLNSIPVRLSRADKHSEVMDLSFSPNHIHFKDAVPTQTEHMQDTSDVNVRRGNLAPTYRSTTHRQIAHAAAAATLANRVVQEQQGCLVDHGALFSDRAATHGIRISPPSVDQPLPRPEHRLSSVQPTVKRSPSAKSDHPQNDTSPRFALLTGCVNSIAPTIEHSVNSNIQSMQTVDPVDMGRAARMPLIGKLAPMLPPRRFVVHRQPSNKSPFLSCPQQIRDRIWTHVFSGIVLDTHCALSEVAFANDGSIAGLPAQSVQPQAIVKLLNRFTISKTCYEDASSIFFSTILPTLVSRVCSWREYEMLERYVLRGCPKHFVRFCLDFNFFAGPKSAIHQIEMRTMVNYMRNDTLATKGAFRVDDSMRDRLQQNGFFIEDKTKPHNQLLTLRRPPQQILSQIIVDGPIGNIYWWIHSFYDYVLINRANWERMSALMADFSSQMRHRVQTQGIVYPGAARFGCLMVTWRECCFDAEQSESIQMAWDIVRSWKGHNRI